MVKVLHYKLPTIGKKLVEIGRPLVEIIFPIYGLGFEPPTSEVGGECVTSAQSWPLLDSNMCKPVVAGRTFADVKQKACTQG